MRTRFNYSTLSPRRFCHSESFAWRPPCSCPVAPPDGRPAEGGTSPALMTGAGEAGEGATGPRAPALPARRLTLVPRVCGDSGIRLLQR